MCYRGALRSAEDGVECSGQDSAGDPSRGGSGGRRQQPHRHCGHPPPLHQAQAPAHSETSQVSVLLLFCIFAVRY